MKNPQAKWKTAAVGSYRNGDTIRTDDIRLTEYSNSTGKLNSRMLYGHAVDPNENRNVVSQARMNQTVTNLSEKLKRQVGRDGKQVKPAK